MYDLVVVGYGPPGELLHGVQALFESLRSGYGVELERTCSGAIPIGPPDTVTTRRGFLIGDAAARTIDPDWPPTLQAYEHSWRKDLAREIQLGHLVRGAYSLPGPLQRAGLRALSGEIGVHMDRPTLLFSREQLGALLSR